MNTCEFCKYLRAILSNPYHYSGVVISRLAVSFATITCCIIVLIKQDALVRWPGASLVTNYVGENVFAAVMLLLSVIAMARLLYQSKPVRIGACIYFLQALLWVYTFCYLSMAVYYGETALRPGQISAILIVTALSLFAFIANPKSHQRG